MQFLKAVGIKGPKLLTQNMPTRWNSLCLMYQRIYELRDALVMFLRKDKLERETHNSQSKELPTISLEDWQSLKEMISILSPLYDATTELSAEKAATIKGGRGSWF